VDEIVLASTDFDPRQAERRTISAIRGNAITLDRKLDYMHFGKITFDVDERGEVGLLTRNIRLQGSADAGDAPFFGGHVMAMGASKMFVEGVEFNRMGQNLTLGRYPIHWHLVGDAKGQYVRNSGIHDTFNRCVTVHGTNFLRVENNVTYNTVGHCFFLEDGIEHGNEYVHNLAIQTKCHTSKPCVPTNLAASGEPRTGTNGQQSKDVLLPSDNTASSFWITNPDNTYRRQCGRGFRRDRLLDVLAGAPERQIRRLGDQCEDLAASNAIPRVQGQRRPLQLRRVHVRPEHCGQQHVQRDGQLAYRP
jgi:cell migration-inducing and hyaluronan-binding protein